MSSENAAAAPAEVVLRVENVGKCYHLHGQRLDRLKAIFTGAQSGHDHWAVRGVSFELCAGESFAIVGRNGSGKSTLLQMITGNVQPTEGRIEVVGRVGALLELGSGFNPEFTGRENVRLQGTLLGLGAAEIEARLPEIAAFADIGEFLDEPVKTYSSGMFVRLAFAVQVQIEPDILIVDEALAVGDSLFQKRCYAKMEELQQKGVALLFVSHDQETVRSLTRRALLLDHGAPQAIGPSGDVVLAYRKLLHAEERQYFAGQVQTMVAAPIAPAAASRSEQMQFGEGAARITDVAVLDESGQPSQVFTSGEVLRIRVAFEVLTACDRLNVAVRLRNKQGLKVYSWGTLNQDIALAAGVARGARFWDRRFPAGHREAVEFRCQCRLGIDLYEVQASVSFEATPDYRGQHILHWRDEAAFFQVVMDYEREFFGGVCDLRMTASWPEA